MVRVALGAFLGRYASCWSSAAAAAAAAAAAEDLAGQTSTVLSHVSAHGMSSPACTMNDITSIITFEVVLIFS